MNIHFSIYLFKSVFIKENWYQKTSCTVDICNSFSEVGSFSSPFSNSWNYLFWQLFFFFLMYWEGKDTLAGAQGHSGCFQETDLTVLRIKPGSVACKAGCLALNYFSSSVWQLSQSPCAVIFFFSFFLVGEWGDGEPPLTVVRFWQYSVRWGTACGCRAAGIQVLEGFSISVSVARRSVCCQWSNWSPVYAKHVLWQL